MFMVIYQKDSRYKSVRISTVLTLMWIVVVVVVFCRTFPEDFLFLSVFTFTPFIELLIETVNCQGLIEKGKKSFETSIDIITLLSGYNRDTFYPFASVHVLFALTCKLHGKEAWTMSEPLFVTPIIS